MTKKRPPPRLPPLLLDELDGLDWALELGTKHWHLRIGGELVAILPLGRQRETASRNILSTRQAIRKYKENRK